MKNWIEKFDYMYSYVEVNFPTTTRLGNRLKLGRQTNLRSLLEQETSWWEIDLELEKKFNVTRNS